jgi:hypothetical protein
MTTRWAGLLAAFGLLWSACPNPTDLGKECVLIRKDPADTDPSDGTNSIEIREGEITPGKDFISFGATECDDLICVRDANAAPGTDPNAIAKGVCSRPCVATSATSCETGDRSVDEDESRRFTCRSLLLDADTLAAIKEADPEKYQRYFGNAQSPDFCVGTTSFAR